MRAVLTRVKNASVKINGETAGEIGSGFLVLLGVKAGDTPAEAEKLAAKISSLRIFEDEAGKMNLPLEAVNGSVLVVSQFTLYADCKKGNRPSFVNAARPETAVPLYELFMQRLTERGIHVEHGVFGADMQVESVNDGPVTIIYDTDTL